MSEHRVDYDRLSSTYDARYKANPLQEIGDRLKEIAHGAVLEVGCGTGRWLNEMRSVAPLAIGADASYGMLKQARVTAPLVNARANVLPFRPGSFDFIYCVNALHHFDDKPGFVADAFALLKPGGTLAIVGIDPRTIRWRYFYEYFDTTLVSDLARYPSFGQIVDWMSAAGLNDVKHVIIHEWKSLWNGAEVFDDPFLRHDSNSTLALLTGEQYERGLARIRQAAEANACFRTALPFGMTIGQRSAT